MTATAIFGLVFLSLSLVSLGAWPAFLKMGSAPTWTYLFWVNFKWKGWRNEKCVLFTLIICTFLHYGFVCAADLVYAWNQWWKFFNMPLSRAMIGGCLLSFLGNLPMHWATTIYGSALKTVWEIQASTGINYHLEPEKTRKPEMLWCRVVFFLAAITLATRAHLVYGS